nr:unnamed protein product [Digitaria exilis]
MRGGDGFSEAESTTIQQGRELLGGIPAHDNGVREDPWGTLQRSRGRGFRLGQGLPRADLLQTHQDAQLRKGSAIAAHRNLV